MILTDGVDPCRFGSQGIVKHIVSCRGDGKDVVILVDIQFLDVNRWIFPSLLLLNNTAKKLAQTVTRIFFFLAATDPSVNVSPELLVDFFFKVRYPPRLPSRSAFAIQ